jgi:hypothetical protein
MGQALSTPLQQSSCGTVGGESHLSVVPLPSTDEMLVTSIPTDVGSGSQMVGSFQGFKNRIAPKNRLKPVYRKSEK